MRLTIPSARPLRQLLVFINAYLLASEKNEICIMAVLHDRWWV